MKAIASILIPCLLMLGVPDLQHAFEVPVQQEICDCCNCCSYSEDHATAEDKCCDEKDACDQDHDCLPGCDCSCHFQITATAYRYMELPGITVQTYHYGHYLNNYTFEYSDSFLQPPRFA